MSVVQAEGRQLVTRTQYARMRGVPFITVQKAALDGRISLTEGGLVDVEAADREWKENSSPPRGQGQKNGTPGMGESNPLTFARARAEHEQLKLELTRAELEAKRGNLVPRELVERVLFDKGHEVRDAVLQVPVRLAASVAASGDPQECLDIMREALREALEGLVCEAKR